MKNRRKVRKKGRTDLSNRLNFLTVAVAGISEGRPLTLGCLQGSSHKVSFRSCGKRMATVMRFVIDLLFFLFPGASLSLIRAQPS